jgi:hypothetical protein
VGVDLVEKIEAWSSLEKEIVGRRMWEFMGLFGLHESVP